MNSAIWVMIPYMSYLGAAVLCLAFWRNTATQLCLSVVASVISIVASLKLLSLSSAQGVIVHDLGAWGAPFGIVYTVDVLSAILLLTTSWVSLCVLIYSSTSLSQEHFKQGYYFLFNILLLGISAAFSTGDLFNLYVCFELLLMSSFVIFSLGRIREQLEACLKYVLINFLCSFFFLLAIAWIYGLFGTLNLAHLAELVKQGPLDGPETAAIYMLILCLAIKAAIFPLFSWLPLSYPSLSPAVLSIVSALMTKLGVYSLIRVSVAIFPINIINHATPLIYWAAIFTMVVGVLGALAQVSIKKILSVHIISQVGYVILALAFFTESSMAIGIYFLIHLMLTKSNLFMIGGVVEADVGTDRLSSLGSFAGRRPFLAINFIVASFCLVGFPPLSGFLGKLRLAFVSIKVGDFFALAIIFLVSLVTLLSMLKIWDQVFWREAEAPLLSKIQKNPWPQYLAIILMNLSILIISLGIPKFWPYFEMASRNLWDSTSYVERVLSR